MIHIFAPNGGSGASSWDDLTDKPFDGLSDDFDTDASDNLVLATSLTQKLEQFDTNNKLKESALQDGTKAKLVDSVNPTLVGTETAVEGLEIGGTKYKVGGGHEMVTGVENLAAVTEASNKVANAKTITEWSNVEMARICVRYLATGNNTIGTWVDNQSSESWDESDWVKSTKLHGILANSTPDDEIKISISTKVPSGKSAPFSGYSYRLDDAYDATRGAIAIKFNEKATANTEVYITLTRTRTNTEIVTL